MLHSDLCVVRWTFVLRSGPTCIFVPVMRIKPSISMVLCLCFNNLSVVLSGPLSLDVYAWCFKATENSNIWSRLVQIQNGGHKQLDKHRPPRKR